MLKFFKPSYFLFSNKKDKEFEQFLRFLLGFKPTDVDIYKLAFTHSSVSKLSSKGVSLNNERLEFLGDAILDSIITDFVYKKFPKEKEGFLTTMRAKIVNRNFLDNIGEQIGLHKFLEIQLPENSETKHYFGNALEAFIGAVYLDKGYDKTKTFVSKKLIAPYVNFDELMFQNLNHKSKLIEFCQKHRLSYYFDTYETNDKPLCFESRVHVENVVCGFGFGNNKKDAEQKAAEIALTEIQKKY